MESKKKRTFNRNNKHPKTDRECKVFPKYSKASGSRVVVEGFYCRCKGCGKTPYELSDYIMLAKIEGYDSPEEAVRNEEGTFNPSTGLFWCTDCYIKAGMPIGQA